MNLGAGDSLASERLWTRDFWLISLATFFVFFSFQMLMPTLPAYVQTLGAPEGIIGLVTGLFAASALMVRPFIGRELDRRGRTGIYRLGLVVFALAVLTYRWADTPSLVLAVRLVHGFAWGLVTTAAGTIVSDLVPPARRGEGMGYYGMFMNMAMAIAPAAGLYVIYHYRYPPLFYASTALALTALLLASRLRQGRPPEPNEANANENLARGLSALFEPRALYPALLTLLLSFGHASIGTFLQIYAQSRGVANVGPFFTVQALSVMGMRPISGRLFDRRGPNPVVIPGLCLVVASLVVLSRSASLGWFLLAGALYGVGTGAALPAFQALAVAGLPPERRGAANATYFSALDLGVGSGGMSLGLVAQWCGFSAMYLAAAGMVLLGLVIYLSRAAAEIGPERFRA
ncbi:MAG: MFS transporter [Moorellales bacterium]